MEIEKWVPLVEYKNFYEVSSFGGVRSVDRSFINKSGVLKKYKGRIIKQRLSPTTGYLTVNIFQYPVSVHRLVAKAFIDNPLNKKCVNHINSIRSDNSISNLEWCTQSENILHGFKHGFMKGISKPGILSSTYKHGNACAGTSEKQCAVCKKAFIPRIVMLSTSL